MDQTRGWNFKREMITDICEQWHLNAFRISFQQYPSLTSMFYVSYNIKWENMFKQMKCTARYISYKIYPIFHSKYCFKYLFKYFCP